MTRRVAVLGAGVVGSVYAALLVRAGCEVTMLARGRRAEQLRTEGLRVRLDGEDLGGPVRVILPGEAARCDALLVAVRGDQIDGLLRDDGVRTLLRDSPAAPVVVMTNPLDRREAIREHIGQERLVWAFSGVGGGMRDGIIVAHRVRQQPTVVAAGMPASTRAETLVAACDERLRREPDMEAWLETHTVFVAAMAAVILCEAPRTRRERWESAVRLVAAMREAFTALETREVRITPGNLCAIFGRVPSPSPRRTGPRSSPGPLSRCPWRPTRSRPARPSSVPCAGARRGWWATRRPRTGS